MSTMTTYGIIGTDGKLFGEIDAQTKYNAQVRIDETFGTGVKAADRIVTSHEEDVKGNTIWESIEWRV